MAADGHHPGQHAAAHAEPQGQGKLRLNARGRLRGKGADEHRGSLRFLRPYYDIGIHQEVKWSLITVNEEGVVNHHKLAQIYLNGLDREWLPQFLRLMR